MLRDTVVAGNVGGDGVVSCDDPAGLLQCTADPMMLVMTSEPSVPMIMFTQKTQVAYFHHLDSGLAVPVFFHSFCRFAANLMYFC